MLMCKSLWSEIDPGRARRRAPIWPATALVALAAAAASCGGIEPADVGKGDVEQVVGAVTQDQICLNGTIADAMAGMRRARGILSKPTATGSAALDFGWLIDH